ncbi:MAG: DNA methyltransferase [Candidatus Hodarchaeales archaeon]|jgi:adenine-specific DNA methylase
MRLNIEDNFPTAALSKLAIAEASNRQHYRPVYSLHKYWARRLGSIFRTIGICLFSGASRNNILRLSSNNEIDTTCLYFQKHDFSDKVIYDPFMGGGTTIVELLRLGAKCVGVDLNPIAYWTTRQQVIGNYEKKYKKGLEELEKKVKSRTMNHHKSTCPSCGKKADVIYYFWIKTVECGQCSRDVELFKYYVLSRPYRSSNGAKNVLFCPICREVFQWIGELKNFNDCPSCGSDFHPFTGNYHKGNYTCSCGFNEPLLKAVKKKQTVLNQHLFALEYYCPHCKVRDYKKISNQDFKKWEESRDKFNEKKKLLKYIPRSIIPMGEKTRALLNYNYHYWHELFNERQLLSLSGLLETIMQINDTETCYFFLTIFSKMLEYHNMLCQYNYGAKKIVNSFNHHAYPITTMPVENNTWGTDIGAGTFESFTRFSMKAKNFNDEPFEKIRTANGIKTIKIPGEKLKATIADDVKDVIVPRSEYNCFIGCRDAKDMHITKKALDAVITDPPYFDNVMYSELSDFFHVWLRLGLKDDFTSFRTNLIPKTNEIVKNRLKTYDAFTKGLTTVFRACHSMLKDEGVLVFTFHHKKIKAYASILESLIQSRFAITNTFHIVSEPFFSPHVKNKDSPVLDSVIVCRKKMKEEPIYWEELLDRAENKLAKTLNELKVSIKSIRKADQLSITRSKIMELYSRHCTGSKLVKNNGQDVTPKKALEIAKDMLISIEIGRG